MSSTGKRTTSILASVVVIAAAAGIGWVLWNDTPSDASAPPAADSSAVASSTATSSSTGGTPSTAAAATTSTQVLEPPPGAPVATDPAPAVTGGQVDVVLSFLDVAPDGSAVEAAGFVNGVVEDGGVCTLTLRQGTSQVRVTSAGLADAATTTCGGLRIAVSSLPQRGQWSGVLSYSSATSSGVSPAHPVEVPGA